MPWDLTLNRWVTILAPACNMCGRIDWLDVEDLCAVCSDPANNERTGDVERQLMAMAAAEEAQLGSP